MDHLLSLTVPNIKAMDAYVPASYKVITGSMTSRDNGREPVGDQ